MDQPQTNFDYTPNADESAASAPAGSFSWQAPEFIEHHHSAGWYSVLILVTVLIAALVYLTAKDIFATATIIVVGVIVGVYAKHKPAMAQYEITTRSLKINGKAYPLNSFKSFTILHEGDLSSLNLLPLKRFTPPITAYFNPAEESKVTNALGDHLPYEDRKMDSIERLSRRLRL